jgi:hypothetical protein
VSSRGLSRSGVGDSVRDSSRTKVTLTFFNFFVALARRPLLSPLYTYLAIYFAPRALHEEKGLSRGSFCYDRFDWLVQSRKPGAEKGSLISSSHNLEKPERCQLHSCCVRLYRGTSRGNRPWLAAYCFVRRGQARRLPLRRRGSSSMFLAVVSLLSFPFLRSLSPS